MTHYPSPAFSQTIARARQERMEFREHVTAISERLKVGYRAGRIPRLTMKLDGPYIRSIRDELRMTQVEFANVFSLPRATVENWECGRRQPDAAAKILLLTIATYPKEVQRVVHTFRAAQFIRMTQYQDLLKRRQLAKAEKLAEEFGK